jgi:hypothetical protein
MKGWTLLYDVQHFRSLSVTYLAYLGTLAQQIDRGRSANFDPALTSLY